MTEQLRWWVVVPMKDIRHAKSRLGGDPGRRRALAVAMARDTLRAAAGAVCVDGVVLVCDQPDDVPVLMVPGVRIEVRPGLDLNDALSAGAAVVRADARRHLAALPADLPYLRSDELTVALGRVARHPRAVVADREGVGTALLTARAGAQLLPAFGPDSLTRHRASGAREVLLPARSGLRRDVDHQEDLMSGHGLGPCTHATLRGGRVLAAAEEGVRC
ncbi:2-phospho-L-lactate guanylyltransferase [Streptomyces sp. NPDC055105]|jgi:2-phospho-L-lactate guanylyltransferase|uniref:2-phospho-L-lactate guanylyltransferase n=1 Tax=Streptomyces sp. NPDC055105 TaxID=3365719 RepID=UPI0037D5C00C